MLTARELDLLVALARHDGGAASKPELLAEVWGFDFEGDDNIVEVYVGYLRTKIDRPFGRRSLQTVRTSATASSTTRDGGRARADRRCPGPGAGLGALPASPLLAAGAFAATLVVASLALLQALEGSLVDDLPRRRPGDAGGAGGDGARRGAARGPAVDSATAAGEAFTLPFPGTQRVVAYSPGRRRSWPSRGSTPTSGG